MPTVKTKKRYQRKDPISHCLTRPDMYVGSTRMRVIDDYIAKISNEKYTISKSSLKSSPAILRIFIEALSNAIDNVERSKRAGIPCTKIRVTIDANSGETSIWNDGDVVPIEIDEDEQCYNHTMIFGQLLTGSNYDDDEERIIAGRNGLGIKLTNIFSTIFTVEGCDPKCKKILKQIWRNNMRNTTSPTIKTTKLKRGYTKVTWIPDFQLFGIPCYTTTIIQLYTRYIIDAAMLSKVNVFLNNIPIQVNTLAQYSQLYSTPTDEKLFIRTKTCEILLTPASEFQVISFVNGVYTKLGGQHVDAWVESIFRPIVDKFNRKGKRTKAKTPKINISDVKQFFRLIVVATVIRPEFDGQDKNKLESPTVQATVKRSHIVTITKWSIMEKIEDIIRAKEMIVLKKAERKRTTGKIDGLDPANNAGGKYSHDCSLFICEGLSAKTYVVAGIDTGVYGKRGRDWFGILPVTGKVLNVRNATPTAIAANKVIVSFIQATGLRHGLDYTKDENFKSLYYGRVILVADADVDGIHIEGLLLNVIHSLFPSLLDRKESYVVSMKTPIARVFRRKTDLLFYDERRFNHYLMNNSGKINAKYFKGLGTTREEDVPDTFGKKMVEYVTDIHTSENMKKVFSRKYADERKEWLGQYSPDTYQFSLDDEDEQCQMTISNFLNGEMIKFSHADCARSIPSGIDGLKESQRKILYGVRKRNLNYNGKSLKVAQLSGYTAEHSNYHHGEQNLQDTIVGMAAGFPGTNNIPLLYPDGGFGTRLEGGKDAASARYIYTKMEGLTEYIFRSEDDPLLTQVNDDGDFVQPEYYIPIIPMILINGCTAGIGTGWSCTVPCYNPLDIIAAIRIWIENDGEVFLQDPDDDTIGCMFDEFIPWYRDFKGIIRESGSNRFVTEGLIKENKRNTSEVTELPIGLWTNKFKEFCEDLVSKKQLKLVKNYSTTHDIHFVLSENSSGIKCSITNLKLQTYLYTSNMVLFNDKNQLKKYDTVDEIINDFCCVRLSYYVKRKKYLLKSIAKKLSFLQNKERFIREVITGELEIMNVGESNIIDILDKNNYERNPKTGCYNYLFQMPMRIFTTERIQQLKNTISSTRVTADKLNATSPEKIWLQELDEFEEQYAKWQKQIKRRIPKKKKHRKK